jgi:hypothetical protein
MKLENWEPTNLEQTTFLSEWGVIIKCPLTGRWGGSVNGYMVVNEETPQKAADAVRKLSIAFNKEMYG